jgi:hypothetical protein
MQQKDIIEKPSIKTWVSICAGAVAGFLLEPSNRHLTWKRKRESSARRTYSPHPQRSRTSKKQVLLADPAAICTKKEKKQVSEGCLLLGFFFRVFGGGHVAGEEGAAGGVAAVPVGTITVSLAIRFAGIKHEAYTYLLICRCLNEESFWLAGLMMASLGLT